MAPSRDKLFFFNKTRHAFAHFTPAVCSFVNLPVLFSF